MTQRTFSLFTWLELIGCKKCPCYGMEEEAKAASCYKVIDKVEEGKCCSEYKAIKVKRSSRIPLVRSSKVGWNYKEDRLIVTWIIVQIA